MQIAKIEQKIVANIKIPHRFTIVELGTFFPFSPLSQFYFRATSLPNLLGNIIRLPQKWYWDQPPDYRHSWGSNFCGSKRVNIFSCR